jgi:hypothetical protein
MKVRRPIMPVMGAVRHPKQFFYHRNIWIFGNHNYFIAIKNGVI